MLNQITKDMDAGFIYLIPTVTFYRNKNLKMLLIGFRFLNFGYTYHHRQNKHIRYNGNKHTCFEASQFDCTCQDKCERNPSYL